MRTILPLLLLMLARSAGAQLYLVDTSASYFENFDRLDSFGTGATVFPAGWQFHERGSAANTTYRAGTGSGTTSDTYSFGPSRSRDRALGSLASGTLSRIVYGTVFINRTGGDINAISVCYRGEQWRRGGSGFPDSLRFSFTTVRGARLDDTGSGRWTEVPDLMFQSLSRQAGGATLNGNDLSRVLSAKIPLMLHQGDSLLIRWCDDNAPGSDDGLAIDSLCIQFHNGPVLTGNHPRLIHFSPDSTATGLSPDLSLRMEFDRAVTAGSGSLYLEQMGSGAIDSIPARSPRLRYSGREVDLSGLQLSSGITYSVRFDSSAFDSLGFTSTGLYDLQWTFRIELLNITAAHPGDPLSLDALPDGRLLIRSVEAARCRLLITAMDGRRVVNQELRISPPRTVVSMELPPGACYGVQLTHPQGIVRRRVCLP